MPPMQSGWYQFPNDQSTMKLNGLNDTKCYYCAVTKTTSWALTNFLISDKLVSLSN